MSRRQARVAEEVHRALSELLRYETQDPRLVGITLSRAEITGDLRRATAFVLPQGTAEEQAAALEALAHARGYLRRALAKRLQLRFAPELEFEVDQASVQDERLEQLLDRLKKQ